MFAGDNRRIIGALAAIILISLGLQVIISWRNPYPSYDEAVYYDLARNIARSGLPIRSWDEGFVYLVHPPLSFYLMSLPFLFDISTPLLWVRMVGSALGVGTMLLTFWMGKGLRGPGTGLLAALLLGVNPVFLAYSHSAWIEPAVGFFLTASMALFLLALKTEKRWHFAASGAVLGLLLLTKYSGFPLALAYFLFLLWRHKLGKEFWRRALPVFIPAVALFSLWPAFLGQFGERGIIGELVGAGTAFSVRSSFLADPPWLFYPRAAWYLPLPFAAAFGLAVVCTVGRVLRAPRREQALLFVLVVTISIAAFVAVQPYREIRHVVPILPVAAVIVASYVQLPSHGKATPGIRRLGLPILVPFALLFLVLSFAPFNSLGLRGTAAEEPSFPDSAYVRRTTPTVIDRDLARVGKRVAELTMPGETVTVAVDGPIVSFHAGRPYRFLVSARFSEVMAMLSVSRVVVQEGEAWLLPFLSEQEKAKFAAFFAAKFHLVDTIGDSRIFVRKTS